MSDGSTEELVRADYLERWADAMERQVAAIRREIRQIRARHRNHPLIAALNKALDDANGNDP